MIWLLKRLLVFLITPIVIYYINDLYETIVDVPTFVCIWLLVLWTLFLTYYVRPRFYA